MNVESLLIPSERMVDLLRLSAVLPFSDREDAVTARLPVEGQTAGEVIRIQIERAVGRVCPPWLQASRDDLVQAATMRVLEIQKKSEEHRDFSSSYLRKVAYAVLVDEIRRLRRRSEVPLETVESSESARTERATAEGSGSTTPEHRFAQRELGEAISDCLAGLKAERRQAVTLFLQGHSVPDAATRLGWTSKKTENLVYRGKADLQRCLEKKGFKP